MSKNISPQTNAMFTKPKENARTRELNIKLLEACKLEDTNKVRALLKKGANLHLLDKTDLHYHNNNERNPVHNAAQIGHVDILRLLVQAGADCNAKGSRDETPLHLAVYNDHAPIVDCLILEYQADLEAKDVDGATAIAWATYENKINLVKKLLKSGANINAPDFEKMTPLHWASYRGHEEMVKLLIEHGADTTQKTNRGKTFLNISTEKLVFTTLY